MKTYLRLLRYVRPHLGTLGLGVGCMVLSTVFKGLSLTTVIPLADKVLTNQPVVIHAPLPAWLARYNKVIFGALLVVSLIYTAAAWVGSAGSGR